MVEITIKPGNKCRISGDVPPNIIRILDQELSFDVPGAQYTQQYKFGGWDGKKRLMSSKLDFGYGLIPRVTTILENYNIPFSIKDKRSKTKAPPFDIDKNLKKLNKTPRYYQSDAANKVFEHDIGIIKSPTGSGKSMISALMISNLGKPANLYVTGKDLLYQFHKFYSEVFDQPIGMIGDGHCEIHKINIVSVWSVSEAFGEKAESDEVDIDELLLGENKKEEIKNCLQSAKVHIFDECHGASCSTIQLINNNIIPDEIYGMSASPWRSDNSEMLIEAMLGHNIVDVNTSELIEKGYLVKPIIKFVEVPKYKGKLSKQYQSIYKQYIVENEVRNGLIVDYAVKLSKLGYKVLVLFKVIKHGEILNKMLQEKVRVGMLSGKDSIELRNKNIKDLEDGNIDVLLASSILDLGIDIPPLSSLVLAGGSKSIVRAVQRLGRIVRPFPGKSNAAMVDFIDNAPFLKDHSEVRYRVYSSEPAYDLSKVLLKDKK